MGFFNIGRSVASMVLIVLVFSNVQGQSSASDEHCPAPHLESQLVSIEKRLNRIETTISPKIKGACTVELASYGYEDSTKNGYVKTSGGSSENVLVLDEQGNHRREDRGVTLFELDPKTCTTKNRQTFDTYESADNRVQLLETLETATTGTIIVGVTVDTAEIEDNVSFRNAVGSFFTRYNMDLSGLRCRDKFAFVMQKGYPKKTAFEMKPKGGANLKIKIGVGGSSVYDVTFSRV